MLVDAETPTLKQISITGNINWDLCVLQENGTGLQCSYAVKITKYLLAVHRYKTLVE